MSVILLDADRSLSSIGSESTVASLFGFPPVTIYRGFEEVRKVLAGLFDVVPVSIKHPIFGDETTLRIELSESGKANNIEAIALDTFSHIVKIQIRTMTMDPKTKTLRNMEMQDWGTLAREGEELVWKLSGLPIPVVCNVHIDYEKDAATGAFYFGPQIPGSLKNNIQKYFDCIFFTKARRNKDGSYDYYWITKPEATRFAKDRKDLLPAEIPQDFQPVLHAYRQAGIPAPKILVVGESGTGKSRALATLPVSSVI